MAAQSAARAQSTSKTSIPPPPPPTPSFILRGHDAPIHSLEFFASNTFLVTGDEAGWISVWDIWRRRQIYKWHGHPSGSVLALNTVPIRHRPECSPGTASSPARENQTQQQRQHKSRKVVADIEPIYILSHGRDNEIHVWDINSILQKSFQRSSVVSMASSITQDLAPIFSLPVNALNFCKMSVLAIDTVPTQQDHLIVEQESSQREGTPANLHLLSQTHQHIYIAVPSPTTATLVDIYDIVKPVRLFASIGRQDDGFSKAAANLSMKANTKWGSVMAIRLFEKSSARIQDFSMLSFQGDTSPGRLHMLLAYEDGSLSLFADSSMSVSGGQQSSGGGTKVKSKMDVLWSINYHRGPVLALDISSDMSFAISCGSDNLLVKYNLFGSTQGTPEVTQVSLKTNGIADVKVRNDNKILALAGWDGRIRIFSCKTLKPLAVLKYHREGLYCIGLANVLEMAKKSDEGTFAEQNRLSTDGSASASSASDVLTAESQEVESKSRQDNDNDSSSNDEDEDSSLEDALEGRRQWTKRHWIAAAGKENRISLWEIY
ncbi:Guanine nucleotide binding protein (G protein), beta polypeptide 1-like [Haplosporangium sp. Z 767]|nr:Guanine nucleotide binding protein (G protein), beta polypeptide 1-like [Haplosporangium sp. Z 767]KAF9197066.1 Guanine nucleotide binding protein (G protein), beta polypeptide 1-like [Haplosporangium sp. Z 11]